MQSNAVVCLLAAGVLLMSCKEHAQPPGPAIVQAPVYKVQQKSLNLERTYVADIQAVRNIELRSKVSGYLANIYVDEGQFVKTGQVLFKLADDEFKAEIARANAVCNTLKAEARIAEVEYGRVKTLVDKNIISTSELQLADSKLKAAVAKTEEAAFNLKNAQHKLSYTNICAPFDGIIDRIPLKNGSLINEGMLITTISDISSVYAYFNISENEYLEYQRSLKEDSDPKMSKARLILANGHKYEQEGKIETVVGEFEPGTGSIAFRAKFPNPGLLLKHKATGKVQLPQDAENAIVIPQKAAFEIQDNIYVFAVDATDTVRTRRFVPAGRVGDYYIVASGINEGERIIYEGIQNLKDGMKIVPLPTSLAQSDKSLSER